MSGPAVVLNRWGWALALFAVIAAAAALFAFSGVTWAGWRPATCAPAGCFCEAPRAGPVVQPANTYSNLAFVLVGLLIVADAPARAAGAGGLIRRRPDYRVAYGLAVVLIGLGSLFYHASLTFAGQWFDLMGMYLQASFMLLYPLARWRPWPAGAGAAFPAAYLALNGALGAQMLLAPGLRLRIFGALVVGALVVEALVHRQAGPRLRVRWLLAALGSFALAYGIWLLDKSGRLCAPGSLLQGHAAWHLLSAAAAGLVYLYYRSE